VIAGEIAKMAPVSDLKVAKFASHALAPEHLLDEHPKSENSIQIVLPLGKNIPREVRRV